MTELSSIADVAGLRRFLAARFGESAGEAEGVLHVAAVWRPPGGNRNVVLRIGDDTPKSAVDFFLLNLARARAEAIVTTGRILREEREVTHDLRGTPGHRAALEAWRREVLGLERPPWLAILTNGRDFDPDHPALHARARPIVLCPQSGAETLRRRVDARSIEVVARADTSLRATIRWLREVRGAFRISIEAGPSTAIDAYRAPVLIDELLLSVFAESSLPPTIAAGELPPMTEIERLLGPARAAFEVDEPSGRWRFERYRCAIVASAR